MTTEDASRSKAKALPSEMNEAQMENYNLIQQLRRENKPETIQATLKEYIRQGKADEVMGLFFRELEQGLKARIEAKKVRESKLSQRMRSKEKSTFDLTSA